jgi:aminopeptidase
MSIKGCSTGQRRISIVSLDQLNGHVRRILKGKCGIDAKAIKSARDVTMGFAGKQARDARQKIKGILRDKPGVSVEAMSALTHRSPEEIEFYLAQAKIPWIVVPVQEAPPLTVGQDGIEKTEAEKLDAEVKDKSPIEKYAAILLRYSLQAQAGDLIVIRAKDSAMEFVNALYRECLHIGAFPFPLISSSVQEGYFFNEAPDKILTTVNEIRYRLAYSSSSVSLLCDENPTHLTGVDPNRMRQFYESLAGINQIIFSAGKFVGALWPTHGYAQAANMSLSDFSRFVFNAVFANSATPFMRYHELHRSQESLKQLIEQADKLRITGPETDIVMSVKGRKAINCNGHVNVPDGEVFTGPVEDSVEGTFKSTHPVYVAGTYIGRIFVRFKKGKVVEGHATENNEYFQQMLSIEGADRVGEIAIGTNVDIAKGPFLRNILFDEKRGVHLALGMGIPETGSKNVSVVHWDLILDHNPGKVRIFVDDKEIDLKDYGFHFPQR